MTDVLTSTTDVQIFGFYVIFLTNRTRSLVMENVETEVSPAGPLPPN